MRMWVCVCTLLVKSCGFSSFYPLLLQVCGTKRRLLWQSGQRNTPSAANHRICEAVKSLPLFLLIFHKWDWAAGNSNSEFLSKHIDSPESEVCDLFVRTGPLLRAECWHDIWDIGRGKLLFFYNTWNLRGFLCSGSLQSSFCTVRSASMILPFPRQTWVWL